MSIRKRVQTIQAPEPIIWHWGRMKFSMDRNKVFAVDQQGARVQVYEHSTRIEGVSQLISHRGYLLLVVSVPNSSTSVRWVVLHLHDATAEKNPQIKVISDKGVFQGPCVSMDFGHKMIGVKGLQWTQHIADAAYLASIEALLSEIEVHEAEPMAPAMMTAKPARHRETLLQ